jgi:hypothetical protein
MLAGALVNGSRGKVVGFYTLTEAAALGVEISLKPKMVKREPGSSKSQEKKEDKSNDKHLRTTEATHQLAENIWRTELVPSPARKGRLMRRNGLLPLNKNAFTLEQKYPLVEFDNMLRMLCVPFLFREEGASGLEVERLQVCFELEMLIST